MQVCINNPSSHAVLLVLRSFRSVIFVAAECTVFKTT